MIVELFGSGHVVDIALAVLAIEFVALVAIGRRRRGIPLAGIAWNAAAGATLLLALRTALTGSGWPWTAAFLTLGLVSHLGDLAQRLRAARLTGGDVRPTGPTAKRRRTDARSPSS